MAVPLAALTVAVAAHLALVPAAPVPPMLAHLSAPPALASAQDLPGVKWLGLIMGLLFIYAAIRAMFGRKK